MNSLTANDATCKRNVQLLRRPLDLATMLRFLELQKDYPDYFKDYQTHKKRVSNPREEEKEIIFMGDMRLNLADTSKGLPSELKGIELSRLHREFVYTSKPVNDPEAAFGFATPIKPELPFTFGIYQLLDDQWDARSDKRFDCSLGKEVIKPGKYQLYKLGEIEVVRGTHLWFTQSWRPDLRFGGDIYKPGQNNLYDFYASLKFDGPLYGGSALADTVLCDQIIFVKK